MNQEYQMYEWHGFGGGIMWIFWVFLIVVVFWIVKTLIDQGQDRSSRVQHKSALEILEERYAKGEIEREEFELKRNDLNG